MERDYSYHIPDFFSGRPGRQRLSWNPGQQAAWGAIMAGIHERKGGVVILGEAGLGKTTLSRALMTSLDLQSVKTIYIADADITFPSLLQCIYNAFSLEVPSDFLSDTLRHLHSLLIEEYRAHRNVVLLLDNAHHLPTTTLTNLWLLAQLEFENTSLIQMVLFGRPALAQRLNQHASPSLKCHLAICVILSFPVNAAPQPAIYQQVVRVARQTMRRIIPAVLHPLRQYVRNLPQTLPWFSTRVRTAAASMRLQLPTLLPRYLLIRVRDCRLPWGVRWTPPGLAGLLARTEVALAAGRSRCQPTVRYIVQCLRSRLADLPRRWLVACQQPVIHIGWDRCDPGRQAPVCQRLPPGAEWCRWACAHSKSSVALSTHLQRHLTFRHDRDGSTADTRCPHGPRGDGLRNQGANAESPSRRDSVDEPPVSPQCNPVNRCAAR
jgi:hypothetical protein